MTYQNMNKVSNVAASLALTPRRIQQLVKDKILPAPNNGIYDLKACILAYKKYLQSQNDKKSAVLKDNTMNNYNSSAPDEKVKYGNNLKLTNVNTEKLRLLSAQATKAELEVQILEEKYIAASEVELIWSRAIIAFRARMLSMPTALARSIIALGSDIAAVTNLLESEIQAALLELSNYKDESTYNGRAPKVSHQ